MKKFLNSIWKDFKDSFKIKNSFIAVAANLTKYLLLFALIITFLIMLNKITSDIKPFLTIVEQIQVHGSANSALGDELLGTKPLFDAFIKSLAGLVFFTIMLFSIIITYFDSIIIRIVQEKKISQKTFSPVGMIHTWIITIFFIIMPIIITFFTLKSSFDIMLSVKIFLVSILLTYILIKMLSILFIDIKISGIRKRFKEIKLFNYIIALIISFILLFFLTSIMGFIIKNLSNYFALLTILVFIIWEVWMINYAAKSLGVTKHQQTRE